MPVHAVGIVVIVILPGGARMPTAYTEIDLLTIFNEVFIFQCDSIASWTFFRPINRNPAYSEGDRASLGCISRRFIRKLWFNRDSPCAVLIAGTTT